jgi:hypothetical protein
VVAVRAVHRAEEPAAPVALEGEELQLVALGLVAVRAEIGEELRALGVQVDYNVVHLRTSLVQLFVLLLQNFEKLVQMIELKRFGGAHNGYPFAPLLCPVAPPLHPYRAPSRHCCCLPHGPPLLCLSQALVAGGPDAVRFSLVSLALAALVAAGRPTPPFVSLDRTGCCYETARTDASCAMPAYLCDVVFVSGISESVFSCLGGYFSFRVRNLLLLLSKQYTLLLQDS